MTELNMLYGNYNNDLGSDADYMPKQEEKRKDLTNAYANMIRDDSSRISGQQIHQIASQEPVSIPVQQPPPQIIQQAPQQPQYPQYPQYQQPQSAYPEQTQQQKRRVQYELSFWDRMSLKRPEVVKLAIFSLVIVFAISIDRISTHYLTGYLSDNVFTDTQEFFIRLSYPIIVFLLLWIAKSM